MLRSSPRRSRRSAGRGADAEQLIEHDARIAHHRQRLRRRRPADRVGVGARVAVGAAAGLVDVLDAQLHRRDRRVLAVAAARRSDRATCRRARRSPASASGAICVRNTALERKWSPPISGVVNASALRTSVLLTMVMWSRNGSSGAQALGRRSKSRPTAAGAHRFFLMPSAVLPAEPCTISIATKRIFRPPLARRCERARAGTIASRNGSASVTPMPLRTVRRERCLLRDDTSRLLSLSRGSGPRAAGVGRLARYRRFGRPAHPGTPALFTTPRMNADKRLSFFAASRTIARTAGMSAYSTRRPSA